MYKYLNVLKKIILYPLMIGVSPIFLVVIFISTDWEDVKDVEYSEVTLKSGKTNKITIKSLTNVLIKTDVGSIDEEWDELLLEKGACVQFQFLEGNWYVIASDGVKFN
jgi:hypothetical protein